jgi:nicotinate-nucleotide--dimethylbenzimidazole phosphoribosyltransferase
MSVAERWLEKTKPPGSLGRIEWIAEKLGDIQRTLCPVAQPASLLLFAGDHGVYEEGVSPYPQAVTAQMVANIANGGAASSVLAAHHGIDYRVFNVGVISPIADQARYTHANVRLGTRNFIRESAMTHAEMHSAMEVGRQAVSDMNSASQRSVVIVGEMGIGNSTVAAAIAAALLDCEAVAVVGPGTGANAQGVVLKASVVASGLQRHPSREPLHVLQSLGGLEIAAMVGAYLEASRQRTAILVDGFIATAALLVAARIDAQVLDVCLFSHRSGEPGHAVILSALNAVPLLDLGMRLGEGTGALIAYPLLVQSCALLANMASFSDAQVNNRQ